MRLLLAEGPVRAAPELSTDLTIEDIAGLYSLAPQTRTWLRCNFVATLDGSAQGSDGRSGTINTEADKIVFEVLRALADVVVIGAGTARTEGYVPLTLEPRYAALRTSTGRDKPLPIALVTRTGELPDAFLAQSTTAPVHVLTTASAPTLDELRRALGDEHVHVTGDTEVDLTAGLEALHDNGLRHVHSEGGPHLLGTMLETNLLDELDLTLSPKLVAGDGIRIAHGPAVDRDYTPRLLLEEDGSLIGRWLRD